MKDKLLPLAVSEEAWAAYLAAKHGAPAHRARDSTVSVDLRCRARGRAAHGGHTGPICEPALRRDALENDLAAIAGLDRYESVGWQLFKRTVSLGSSPRPPQDPCAAVSDAGRQPSEHDERRASRFSSPRGIWPSTSSDPARSCASTARWAWSPASVPSCIDQLVDAALRRGDRTGERHHAQLHQRRHHGRQVRPGARPAAASVGRQLRPLRRCAPDVHRGPAGGLGRGGQSRTSRLSGTETRGQLRWLHDGQDSPVVPSGGLRSEATVDYIFDSPDVPDVIELIERTTI